MFPLRAVLGLALVLGGTGLSPGEEGAKPAAARTVEEIAASARKSVVMILSTGRDGKRQGVGTGFVVGRDGLIATNLHVIGEGRPITVQTADGKHHEATAVHATDRASDLAVIRIAAKELPALELGDSDALKQGQPVVALGNPAGLEYSVVSGVVSGRREIDGRSMIQIAIPIEPGNSGGPLLDMQGRVHGLLTLKSAVTANLGFAMPGNALKPLLKKPNPIPMARWLTIGALDPEEWTPLFGARWRQRAGRLQVDGVGEGFGGRSLCLSKRPVPKVPYEIAVTVKLDDERGAAGLIFHADGKDRHYGFYPSGGELRLTRFDGPDVFSWKILHQEHCPHYRPGEWNTFKVRVEKDKFLCYCNECLVLESTDTGLSEGKVGVAKFRDTKAQFKHFQVGPKLGASAVPAEVAGRIGKMLQELSPDKPAGPEVVDRLVPDGAAGMTALRQAARRLEQQAAQLRLLAEAVHHKRVLAELAKAVSVKDEEIGLLQAALLLARLDNEELEIEPYRKEVERMAREIGGGLARDADEKAKLAALNKYLFQERGYHGSRGDYYHRSNSYLNEVIDDREGLPITLSVLYMEVARRLGLKVEGVGLPGHFVVRHVPAKGDATLIDVFEGGAAMSRDEAARRVQAFTGRPLQEEDLQPAAKKAILVRMLHNLLGLARDDRDVAAMLRYLDAVLTITPDGADERWARAVLRYQTGQRQGVLEDTDWVLKHHPKGLEPERVLELRRLAERMEK
jgi:regulator of sirC expression with transglutaminase-like and TPR domain